MPYTPKYTNPEEYRYDVRDCVPFTGYRRDWLASTHSTFRTCFSKFSQEKNRKDNKITDI